MLISKLSVGLLLASLALGACQSRGSGHSGDETAAIAVDSDDGEAMYLFVYFNNFKASDNVDDWQACLYYGIGNDLKHGNKTQVNMGQHGVQFFTDTERVKNILADTKNPNGLYVNWGDNVANRGDLKNFIKNNVKGGATEKQLLIDHLAAEFTRYMGKTKSGSLMASTANFIDDRHDIAVIKVVADLVNKTRNPTEAVKSQMGVTKNQCPAPKNILNKQW